MLIPPRTALDTSIPNVITVISVPRVALSEKLKTIGEARVCMTPRQKVISAPMTTRVSIPFLPVRASQPVFSSAENEDPFSAFLPLRPFFTARVVETVTKKVQISRRSSSRISEMVRRKPARTGETRYLAEPAICTRPLALLYCSGSSRSVMVAL